MRNKFAILIENEVLDITSTLEIEGYKYHVAKDGKQAIIEATTQNPGRMII